MILCGLQESWSVADPPPFGIMRPRRESQRLFPSRLEFAVCDRQSDRGGAGFHCDDA